MLKNNNGGNGKSGNNGGSRTGRATMAQIAEAAGVSPSTVSFVLGNKPNPIAISEATRYRVLNAAKLLGYRPNAAARTLATGRSEAVLVAVVRSATWNFRAFSERLHGIMDVLTPLGYAVHICTVEPEMEKSTYADILLSGRADGVLLSGNGGPGLNDVLYKMSEIATRAGVPMVPIANEYPPDIGEAVVDAGDVDGGELATLHLFDHGHRRIALVTVDNQPWAAAREEGYRLAHEKVGVSVDPALIVRVKEHDQRIVYEAACDLATYSDITALFVVTDMLATAAISALKSVGRRLPDDCAVVGYDNIESWGDYIDPPLTSVAQAVREGGRKAAEALVSIIEKRPLKNVQLPVSLVCRESCGCNRRLAEASSFVPRILCGEKH